jgi:isopenicillin-N epimerase
MTQQSPGQDTTPPSDTRATAATSGSWSESRRHFLRMLSAGAGSAVVGGLYGCGGGNGAGATAATLETGGQTTTAAALAQDADFWAKVQSAFVKDGVNTTLNADIGAVVPRISVEALRAKALASTPVDRSGFTELTGQRSAIAASLGAQVDEVALTNGATVGFMSAITGLEWTAGDVILYTNHEHPNIVSLLKVIERFFGVRLFQIDLALGPRQTAQGIVDAVEEAIARAKSLGRPKALVWSSPTYQTGAMLPVARLARVARRHALVSICDAAHLVGMAALDYSRLGVDFMTASGHKWQCGPNLTGILIARNRVDEQGAPPPTWRPSNTSTGIVVRASGDQRVDVGAMVSRSGGATVGKFDALTASSQLWDSIGRARIETYSVTLGAYLKEKIVRGWGEEALLSPSRDPELLSGLTAFDPFVGTSLSGDDAAYADLVARMRDLHRFTLRKVTLPAGASRTSNTAIRISTPLWINSGDIDRLVEGLTEVTVAMRGKRAMAR